MGSQQGCSRVSSHGYSLRVDQIQSIHDTHGGYRFTGHIHSSVGIGYLRVLVMHVPQIPKGIKKVHNDVSMCPLTTLKTSRYASIVLL